LFILSKISVKHLANKLNQLNRMHPE